MKAKSTSKKPRARTERAKPRSVQRVVRATWEYSRYRATLKRNGRTFAIVTPDGRNALNPFDEFVLLKALNGGSNNKVRDARAESGASPSVEAPTE